MNLRICSLSNTLGALLEATGGETHLLIPPVLAFLTLCHTEPRVPEESSEQSGASIKPLSPTQDGDKEQRDHNAQNDTSSQDA